MHHPLRAGVMLLVLFACCIPSALSMSLCPSKNVCSCSSFEIICICENRQDVTLSSIFNFDINTIIVKKCGTVRLPLTSLLNLQLLQIEMDDIQMLEINSYALAGVLGLNKLSLRNIQRLEVLSHAFSGLSNITHIELINVTIPILSQWAFGGVTDVGLLSITDSVIGIVEPLAFILSNVTTVKISNTEIDTFMNTSMIIHNANHLEFTNCFINNTDNSTFSLAEIGTLMFSNCSILHTSGDVIFAKEIDTFIFQNCFVKRLCHKALWSIEVTNHVQFAENRFEILEPGSLFSTIGPFGTSHGNISVDVYNNSFICDCSIVWLWADNHLDAYKIFLDTSFCSGPVEVLNLQLARLQPKSGKDQKCDKIALKSKVTNTDNAKPTITNDVERTVKFEAETAFSRSPASLLSQSLQLYICCMLMSFFNPY